MGTPSDLIRAVQAEIGYDRFKDPLQGTKYGRAYAKLTGVNWYSGNGVPYCAMFVSIMLRDAGVTCPGYPTAYVPSGVAAARKVGAVLSNPRDCQPGDVINFDWDPWNNNGPDHVGIVEANLGWAVQTIEGNTSAGTGGSQGNGGKVARRIRSWSVVHSVIRPTFTANQPPAHPTQAPQKEQKAKPEKLKVDGIWGEATSDALQYVAGTARDGEIWGQNLAHKHRMPGCTGGWKWMQWNPTGSPAIRWWQRAIGADPDGIMGPSSIDKTIWCVGNKKCDQRLDKPSVAIMGMQNWLNQRMGY